MKIPVTGRIKADVLKLIEHMIYAKSFAHVNSSNPHRKPVIQELGFPYFTDDETLTQKGQVTHLGKGKCRIGPRCLMPGPTLPYLLQ